MLCYKPFMMGTTPIGCGWCVPCKVAKRKMWTARQVLEALAHEHNSFITLTYNDHNFPEDGSVSKIEMQLFLKRLRKHTGKKFRYVSVGEYGSKTFRPHYHLSMFGLSNDTWFDDGLSFTQKVEKAWPKGFVYVAEFNAATARYIAQYVVKKMSSDTDPRLEGRNPEFCLPSLRPGIGALAVPIITKALEKVIDKLDDVPKYVQLGKRKFSLDRYMLRLIRDAVGYSDEYIQELKDNESWKRSAEVLAVYLDKKHLTFRETYNEVNAGRIKQVAARERLFPIKEKL